MAEIVRNKKGVILIFALGILALIFVIAIPFALNARLELKAAANFRDEIKAKYLAEAGINRAIAELRADAKSKFVYSDGDIAINGQEESFADGTYTVVIKDEQRKININNANILLLRNLGLGEQQTANLIDYRDSDDIPTTVGSATGIEDDDKTRDAPFYTIEEVKLVHGIGQGTFNDIKEFITVTSYKDPNCNNRSPVNINTAEDEILKSVLKGLSDGTNTISDTEANSVVTAIKTDINNHGTFNHPYGWSRFKNVVKAVLSDVKTNVIVKNCNPNKIKPVIYTTEFCFCSGGHYFIEAIGKVKKDEIIVSEREIKAGIKLYDIWVQTTKEEFRGDVDVDGDGVYEPGDGDIDFNNDGDVDDIPGWERVNWKNSCPINYDCLKQHIYNPANATTVPNALKVGFWDDFEEDYSTDGTDSGDWKSINSEETFEINKDGNGLFRTWWSGAFVEGQDYFPDIELDGDKWKFHDFSIRVRMDDEQDGDKHEKRKDLKWPSVPRSSAWEGEAPEPYPPGAISDHCHQMFLNTSHLKFGNYYNGAEPQWTRGAIFCSTPQLYDIVPNETSDEYDAIYGIGKYETDGGDHEIYGDWVSYNLENVGTEENPDWDIAGPIYFAPPPDIKSKETLQQPNLMIFCNDWVWGEGQPWYHSAPDGTKAVIMSVDKTKRTFQAKVTGGLIAPGVNDGLVEATVYYDGGSLSTDTSPPGGDYALKDRRDRVVSMVGMGNLFDAENIRIIPKDVQYDFFAGSPWDTPAGEYTSIEPDFGSVEQGAVAGTVTLLQGADINTTANLVFTNPTSTTSLQYTATFHVRDDDIEDTPVLEDVFVTYLPPVKFLFWREE